MPFLSAILVGELWFMPVAGVAFGDNTPLFPLPDISLKLPPLNGNAIIGALMDDDALGFTVTVTLILAVVVELAVYVT